MAANRKTLGKGAIAATPGTNLYQVGANASAKVLEIDLCNTTAGALTIQLHFVASGGSAATSNALLYGTSIDANTTLQWTGEINMTAGEFIQAIGSGAGLTAIINGEETRL